VPDEITPADLDREIRAELRGLPKPQFETVARHLVAAGRLVDEDPEQALAHALAARRVAARIAAVREAVGIAAYHAGQWQTAMSELRTYHRISGRLSHLAVVADCERALGRPERAIDLYRTADSSRLTRAEAIELLIVAAGARRDLGQRDAAVAMLQVPELTADEAAPWVARLRYAYADMLLAAGRTAEAREWFVRAAAADAEDATDAAERALELDGVTLEEVEETPPEAGVPDEASAGEAATEEATAEEAPTQAPATEPADQEPDTEKPDTEGPDHTEEPATGEPTTGEPTTGETATVEAAVAPAEPAPTPDRPQRLVDAYDLVILDLDGVVYVGEQLVPAADEAIARLRREGVRVVFATNNASRSPGEVADLLVRLGIEATADVVLTSAAVAADALARRLEPDAAVLVVGTEALAGEIRRAGLRPVDRATDEPRAVVQGYGPHVGWSHLAEAHLAIQAGALWAVTNTDRTLPSPRGMLPGNGSLVAVLRTSLGREPDLVVGKPQPALFTAAASRTGARTPLVVGDRLDTDIEGAHRAGMDSLLVLTGVDDAARAREAPQPQRPTFVGADLTALFAPGNELAAATGASVA